MAKRKSIDELLQAAEAAEKRAKDLRAKAKKRTQAEEAKTNAAIIKAVRVWLSSLPEEKQRPWADVPQLFYDWADRNKQKYSGNEQSPNTDKQFGG